MLWDKGWWEPLHDPAEGLKDGKLHFRLHGAADEGRLGAGADARQGQARKLAADQGARRRGRRPADALLKRHATSVADGPRAMTRSPTSGPRMQPARATSAGRCRGSASSQLATLHDAPPDGDDWRHETKFDGYRCLAALGNGGVRLYTRNGQDWTDRFGTLCRRRAGAAPASAALIDGEVVAGDGHAAISAALQEASEGRRPAGLLRLRPAATRRRGPDRQPLTARRAALEAAPRRRRRRWARSGCRRSSTGRGAEIARGALQGRRRGHRLEARRRALSRRARTATGSRSNARSRHEFVVCGWSPRTSRDGRLPRCSSAATKTAQADLSRPGRHRLRRRDDRER